MILIDLNCKDNKLYNLYYKHIETLNLIYIHISFNLSYVNLINDKLKYSNVLNKIKLKLDSNNLRKELVKIYNSDSNSNENNNKNNNKINNEYVIFSNEFLELNNIVEVILNKLIYKFKDDIDINIINKTNTFKYNIFKYLDKLNINNKVCIFDSNIIEKDLIYYTEKFKYIDIVNTKVNNKKSNILNIIDKINNEYGTTINYVNKYDLTKYDICIINEKIDMTKYVFNKYVYKLNLIDSDYDIYSLENKMFNKYKEYILNKDMFSKNKIGQVFLKDLTSSV